MEIIDQTYIINSEPFTINDIKKGGSVDESFEILPIDKLPNDMKAYYRIRKRDLAIVVEGTKAAFQSFTSLEIKIDYYDHNDALVDTMQSGRLTQVYTSLTLHGEHIKPSKGNESMMGIQQTSIPASAEKIKVQLIFDGTKVYYQKFRFC